MGYDIIWNEHLQILGANRSRDTGFQAKKLKSQLVRGLNRSSSITNCGKRINFLNLEAPGDETLAFTFKLSEFRYFFFLSFIV